MLDAKVAQLLNEQVNKEFYSAYLYLDFSISVSYTHLLRDRGRHRRRPPVPKRGDREKGPPGPAVGRAVCPDRGTVTQGALHHPTD